MRGFTAGRHVRGILGEGNVGELGGRYDVAGLESLPGGCWVELWVRVCCAGRGLGCAGWSRWRRVIVLTGVTVETRALTRMRLWGCVRSGRVNEQESLIAATDGGTSL